MSKVGLTNMVYAIMQEDSDIIGGTPSYGPITRITGAIMANIKSGGGVQTQFADDGPHNVATSMGEITLEIKLADLPLDVQAALLGSTMTGAINKDNAQDTPPWVAIGYKTLKANGGYRYYWLLKGKFAIPEDNSETKKDTLTFQEPTIVGSFVKRECDDDWRAMADEDSLNYVAAVGTNWFSIVGGSETITDTTAPTISSVVPADSATAVAVTSTVVWTFDEALAYTTINANNFYLQKNSDDSLVAGTLSVDTTRKIVTFTPNENLEASTTYDAYVTGDVTDIYGNAFTAADTSFTTA